MMRYCGAAEDWSRAMAMGQETIPSECVIAMCEVVLAIFNKTPRGPVKPILGQGSM
jgi:hypothetical protein